MSGASAVTQRLFAAIRGQRHPADSSRGLDHLLPAGLGKDEHVRRACALPSPFAFHSWPESDVSFVLDMICVRRDCLPGFARRQRHILSTVATALFQLEQCLAECRVPSAQAVAAAKKPGFVAFLTAFLKGQMLPNRSVLWWAIGLWVTLHLLVYSGL